MHGADELEVVDGLRGEGRGVAVPVALEGLQEGVVVLLGDAHLRGLDEGHAVGEGLDVEVGEFFRRVEQGGELAAKLRLRGVHHAVGLDHRVGHGHELAPPGRVEALEELEAPELELRGDELVGVLPLGDGLGEVRPHLRGHAVGHLVEVRRPLLHDGVAQAGVVGEGGVGAAHHQLRDVVSHVLALALVEVPVEVTDRGQVPDDRLHLLLGGARVITEGEHLAAR